MITSSAGVLNEPCANSFPALNAKQDARRREAAACEGRHCDTAVSEAWLLHAPHHVSPGSTVTFQIPWGTCRKHGFIVSQMEELRRGVRLSGV